MRWFLCGTLLLLLICRPCRAQMSPEEAMKRLEQRIAEREGRAKSATAPVATTTASTRPSKALSALFDAAKANNEVAARQALTEGAAPGGSGDGGAQPLHWAAAYGAAKVADILIAKGASVDARAQGGTTPLQLAAEEGQTKLVQLLLDNGAAVDTPNDDRMTALHLAVSYDRHEVVDLLLSRGANIAAVDSTKSTPLHLAAAYGATKSVKSLLGKGADASSKDTDGHTALDLAEANDKKETAAVIRDSGKQ